MKLVNMEPAFTQDCLRLALLVSLLSVWVLVGLFYYLNRYARRNDFGIWTGAWTFYAFWLTFSLGMGDAEPTSALFTINQSCVSMSAVFLLWGSLCCLGLPIPRRLSVVVALFLATWVVVSPQLMTNALQIHLPVFILLGLCTPFATVCFLRLRKEKASVGLGLLSLCFLLWVIYVGSYPFHREHGTLYTAGFFVAAALQLFIAAAMVVVLFNELQSDARKVQAELDAVREERFKLITTKEACEHLYNRMLATEVTEKAVTNMRRAQLAAAEREQLQALGQMAGDVAHDINNALSPITAYSELLLNSLPDLPEGPRRRLEKINQAAENVAQIVAHMREFHRSGLDPESADAATSAEADTSATTSRLDPDLPAGAPPRPLRILCIDDETELREVMHEVLRTDHHQVTLAKDGKEGLQLFRSGIRIGVPFDVVITDLDMPEINGRHVARAVKTESPATSIIMLTGWGSTMELDSETSQSVDAVIGKPPRPHELSSLLFQITEKNVKSATCAKNLTLSDK